MSQQEIIEGNKLIAEFMGFVRYFPNMNLESDLSKVYYYPYIDRIFDEGLYTSTIKMTSEKGRYTNQCIRESHHLKDMQFHKSWSWLMPVFEKIQYIADYCPDLLDGYYSFDFQIDLLNGVDFKVGKERIYLQTAYGPGQLIDAVWSGIIAFIKWFNEHKTCKNN